MVNPIIGIRGMLGQSAISDGITNATQQSANISAQEHLKKQLEENKMDTERTKKTLENDRADLKSKEDKDREQKRSKRKKNISSEEETADNGRLSEGDDISNIKGHIIDIKA